MRGFETSDERKAGRLMSLAIYSTPIHTQFAMKRLFPILSLLILALVCPAKDKPNILWLITDNCNLDFGCFGRQGVHTPHLDQLAVQGVRYNRVFSTAPVCAPSRSAFMTGMYQTSVNLHHFPDHRDDGFRLPEGSGL